ncbi:MAG TPA: transcriptional regulator [Oribacterium sp.]|nr:transcriptional regulator [Oribacterium sp.]
MVFSSIPFLFYFLPLCLILYYLVPFRWKNYVLLAFSLLFYAWGEPVYILLMIFETLSDYTLGRCMARADQHPALRRLCLLLSIFIDLGCLGFFKYADFLVETVNALAGTSITPLHLGLPIGISFFTFQTMSYTIDLYKREVNVEKNYFYYLTYVSMFPQLIAGPIVRFSTVNEELHARAITFDGFVQGGLRFLQGLFKKVLLANTIGSVWELIKASAFTLGPATTTATANAGAASAVTALTTVLGPGADISVLGAWLGGLCFTLQLYFDFSAYSDMAIGMGRMLGFHYLENFNYPLSSVSVTDFWRRWHISLSTWFRDYVYIPLGGNRHGKLKQLRNMFIVWFLTGLWHGAAWNFVLWGLYYGVLLAFEKDVWGKALQRLPRLLQHLYALLIVVFGFIIFVFDDMAELREYIRILFGMAGVPLVNRTLFWYLRNNFALLLIGCLLAFPIYPWVKAKLQKQLAISISHAAESVQPCDDATALASDSGAVEISSQRPAAIARARRIVTLSTVLTTLGYLALFLLTVAYLVNDTYNPFLYFRF